MGIHTQLHVKRSKPFLDVSLVRSKTGYAILRGSSFYDRTLNVSVKRFSRNASAAARSIEHQKQIVINRQTRNMNRSEKLVNAYNLPPLKSTAETSAGTKSIMNRGDQVNDLHHRKPLLKERHKNTNKELLGSKKLDNSIVFDSMTSLRGTMSSPAPREYLDDSLDSSTGSYSKPKDASLFPAIMVQKCDEKSNSPRTPRRNKTITDDMRTLSANNLYVPSPLTGRRQDMIKAGFQNDNMSRSEGCLHKVHMTETDTNEDSSLPSSAPIHSDRSRISYDRAVEEFRQKREMYSPSTPRRPVRLIALSEQSRSNSTGDVATRR